MTDVGLGTAKPAKKAKQPKRRSQVIQHPACQCGDPTSLGVVHRSDGPCYYPDERLEAAEPIDSRTGEEVIPDDLAGEPALPPDRPVNPYAPTGWRKKQRVEFDLELPSGQLCRVSRLERDDLLRLNLMKELNTFAPMLLDQAMSDEERTKAATDAVQQDPDALQKMIEAIDKVVMAATVAPKITNNPKLVNEGTEKDWANPNFIATVHIDNIDTFERMFIFGAAFGRSMDELKSIFEQAEGVDSLANVPGLSP